MIERIVVASDRSDTAARAVAWAAEMARRYEAQLTIVQAFVPGPPPGEAETELAVYAEQIAGPGTRTRVAAGSMLFAGRWLFSTEPVVAWRPSHPLQGFASKIAACNEIR